MRRRAALARSVESSQLLYSGLTKGLESVWPSISTLLGSLPSLTTDERKRLTAIPGLPPVLLEKPVGCPFAVRCNYAFERCQHENPPLLSIGGTHRAACWWDVQEGRPRNA